MTMPGTVLVNLKHIRREKDGRIYLRRGGRSIRLREKPARKPSLPNIIEHSNRLERQKPMRFPHLTRASHGSVASTSTLQSLRRSNSALAP
jgi:hypothetical protein